MNKRIIMFVGLFLLSSMPLATFTAWKVHPGNMVTKDLAQLKSCCLMYATTLLLSGGVGALTGSIARHFENHVIQYMQNSWNVQAASPVFFLRLFSWMFESEIRNDIINAIQSDLDDCDINYKKGLMFKNAWLASWLAYLRD